MIGWGCGLNMARDGCVKGIVRTMESLFLYCNSSGLPQGIVFDVGDYDHSSVTTCFCGSELCNTEHWCDGCRASSSTSLLPALASLAITMALIAWWLFCERCLCAFVFPTRTLLLIKDEKLKCHKSSSGCVVRGESRDSPLKYALSLYFLFSIFLRLETRSIQICTCTLNYPRFTLTNWVMHRLVK